MGFVRILCMVSTALVVCASSAAYAKSPEENYRDKCSVCHDGGAGQAPRLQDKVAWGKRAVNGRQALYQSALVGKPNTAMAAKGGYPELSDKEVRDLVDYILKVTGNASAPLIGKQANASVSNAHAESVSDHGNKPLVLSDLGISQLVAERLRRSLGSTKATLDEYEGVITVRGLGIKVQTQQGVTLLTGSVKESELIAKAEAIAGSTKGVTKVMNKLIAASVFEWD